MKNKIILTIVAFALVLGSNVLRAQDVSDLAKVRFTGIREMALKVEGNEVFADVVVEITNESDKVLVIKDALYQIKFERPLKDLPVNEVILDAAAPVSESVLPASSAGKPTRTNVLVTVKLGDTEWTTAEDVIGPLFNIVGKRPKSIKITLDGRATVGVKAGQATDFGTGARDVRFEFEPVTNKDEALLR